MPKKQSDGRYRAKITIGHDPDGKPIHRWASGRTKMELEASKAELRAYYIDGAVHREDVLFAVYARQWYETRKEPFISASSKTSYVTDLNNHIIPVFGMRMLRAIQPMDIQSWINRYAGKSKSKLNNLIAIMHGVMSSAVSEGILQRDPTVGLVRPKPTPPTAKRKLTADERAAVERVGAEHKHGAMLAVMYYFGLRRGEALGLLWGDFDWQRNVVHIQRDIDYKRPADDPQGQLKNRMSDREIPIDADVRLLLYDRRQQPDEYLFYSRGRDTLAQASFMRRWMELMIACSFARPADRAPKEGADKVIPDIRFDWVCEITPHYLRHDYASRLYEAGVEPAIAMRLLGHSDYNTTIKLYTHIADELLQEAGKLLENTRKKKKVARKLPEQ